MNRLTDEKIVELARDAGYKELPTVRLAYGSFRLRLFAKSIEAHILGVAPKSRKPAVRSLGILQQEVIEGLDATGYWYPGCGWQIGTVSAMMNVLNSLIRRGLVKCVEEPYRCGTHNVWRLKEEKK
jgi:hypothetical protein